MQSDWKKIKLGKQNQLEILFIGKQIESNYFQVQPILIRKQEHKIKLKPNQNFSRGKIDISHAWLFFLWRSWF